MKRKRIAYTSLLALALFLSFGVSNTNAFFGKAQMSLEEKVSAQQKMFEEKAKILGVSAEEIKNAWANGQNIKDFARSKGVSEAELKAKMQAYQLEQMKTELKALVDKGVITQAQMDSRLKFMTEKHLKTLEKMDKIKQKGKMKLNLSW